jgi:hypothetical protein
MRHEAPDRRAQLDAESDESAPHEAAFGLTDDYGRVADASLRLPVPGRRARLDPGDRDFAPVRARLAPGKRRRSIDLRRAAAWARSRATTPILPPDDLRRRIEHALGVSLADVRIYADQTAAAAAAFAGAHAFAVGRDVFFGEGAYRPGTIDGDWLIAHELAHTVQSPTSPTDADEADADVVANRVTRVSPHVGGDVLDVSADADREPGRSVSGGGGRPSEPAHNHAARAHWLDTLIGGAADIAVPGSRKIALDAVARSGIKQIADDLVASIRESDKHSGPVLKAHFGDEWEAIKANWPVFVATLVGLLAAEVLAAALIASPHGAARMAGVLLQMAILAFVVGTTVVDIVRVVGAILRWLDAVKDANGDPAEITKASKEFCQAVAHLLMIIIAVLAAKGISFIIKGAKTGLRHRKGGDPKAGADVPPPDKPPLPDEPSRDVPPAETAPREASPPTDVVPSRGQPAKERSAGNQRASAEARARRDAQHHAETALPPARREMADALLEEHPHLNSRVAEDAVQGAESVKGAGGAGADVNLLNGRGREVSVHSGRFSQESILGHLLDEVRQSGTSEIYLQLSSAGATREGLLRMIPQLRRGAPDLDGVLVRIYGPNGLKWWEGTFRSPEQ